MQMEFNLPECNISVLKNAYISGLPHLYAQTAVLFKCHFIFPEWGFTFQTDF